MDEDRGPCTFRLRPVALPGRRGRPERSRSTRFHSVSLAITVGSNTYRIAKIVIVANCDGSREPFTRRNVPIDDKGIFGVNGGRYVSIVGTFRDENRVTGSLTTNQCGFFGGDFAAMA